MPHFICSPVCGRTGCFHFLAIRNHAVMNDLFTDFPVTICFQFSWVKGGIARSYGESRFNSWRKCQVLFRSGRTASNSHQQGKRVGTAHPQQHSSFNFFTIVTLLGMRCYLTVLLISICPMTNDDEQLFLCLWAIR